MRRYRGPKKPLKHSAKLEAYFWSRVAIGDGCWLWTAGKEKHGYGIFEFEECPYLAHRVAYFLKHGDLRDGCVLHSCDIPACVRPDHLFLGSKADNSRDMCLKLRQNKRLIPDQVYAIRKAADAGATFASLARQYGVSDTAIGYIAKRRHWRHLPEVTE